MAHTMKPLSEAEDAVLDHLEEGSGGDITEEQILRFVADPDAAFPISSTEARAALRSLKEAGFVQRFPRGSEGLPSWQITKAGLRRLGIRSLT